MLKQNHLFKAAVAIRYQSSSGPIFATVFTDTSGQFIISSIPDGPFQLSPLRQGLAHKV
ncbi:hypothetical protein F6Y02_00730 [Bacillus megaterium]|nr:hypothetical protein [Priestia megaterium]